MEALDSMWTAYQESPDELRKSLLYASLELESLKSKETESQETVRNLLNLLEVAYKERDEARDQLQTIFNKFNIPMDPVSLQPDSPPVLMPTTLGPNSSLSESNSLSNSLDSLFDHGSSSPFVFPHVNMTDSSSMGFGNCVQLQPNVVQQVHSWTTTNTATMHSIGGIVSFGNSLTVDSLIKGKTLPQKGKLMEAMKETGPLLQTLIVSGHPLPQWRNPPPPLPQPFKTPHVAPIKSCTELAASLCFNQKQMPTTFLTPGFVNVAQTCSGANAMLGINNALPSAAGPSFSNLVSSNSSFDNQNPIAKRLRLQ